MSLLCIVFAPTIRDQIERLGYWRLWGHITEDCARRVLAALAEEDRVVITGDEAALQFGDLVAWIERRDDGDKSAQARVDAALDALAGRPL